MPSPTGTDETTRQRVLAAAVEIILEEGYYRASSNHIAKRAGVSWGVIQYHFGSRERLLLDVIRDGNRVLVDSLRDAEIHGGTVAERLDSLAGVVWEYYRRPEFLAYIQVLLNLSKEPRTSADTVQALTDIENAVGTRWRELVDQAISPEHRRADLGGVIFYLIRGLAIGSNLLEAIPYAKPHGDGDAREVLVQALSLYVAAV